MNTFIYHFIGYKNLKNMKKIKCLTVHLSNHLSVNYLIYIPVSLRYNVLKFTIDLLFFYNSPKLFKFSPFFYVGNRR